MRAAQCLCEPAYPIVQGFMLTAAKQPPRSGNRVGPGLATAQETSIETYTLVPFGTQFARGRPFMNLLEFCSEKGLLALLP